jgi:hypothetical protein
MQCSILFVARSCITRCFASQAKKRPSWLDSTISLDLVRLHQPPKIPKAIAHGKFADLRPLQFLQRGRVLSLWRTIVRGTRRISDPNTREETLRFAKDEFKRNKEVKDIVCLSTHKYTVRIKNSRC